MISRVVLGVTLIASAPLSVALAKKQDADRPRITAFEAEREQDQVSVTYRLANGLSEETLERIQAGISVSYRHRVEVLSRRTMWTDKVVARAKVETSVTYDSLNRRYALTRRVEVKQKKKPIVETTGATSSVEEMRAWMTELNDIPKLELPADVSDERLRVKVESTMGRRYLWYLIPSRIAVSAERKLEP